MENLETTPGTLAPLQPICCDWTSRKAHMAGDLNKPIVLGHGQLPYIRGRRIFIKPSTKGVMSSSVFLTPTHESGLSFFNKLLLHLSLTSCLGASFFDWPWVSAQRTQNQWKLMKFSPFFYPKCLKTYDNIIQPYSALRNLLKIGMHLSNTERKEIVRKGEDQ
jgi:hypothetical protein